MTSYKTQQFWADLMARMKWLQTPVEGMSQSDNRTPRGFDKSKLHKGKGICRWCGVAVKKPRLSWCSDKCVKEYQMVSDWGIMRKTVLERDHHRCQICGFNGRWFERLSKTFHELAYPYTSMRIIRADDKNFQNLAWRAYENTRKALRRGLLECDHIIPLVEGGPHTVENLRILCVACHKKETSALAKRRAKKRNPIGALNFGTPAPQ